MNGQQYKIALQKSKKKPVVTFTQLNLARRMFIRSPVTDTNAMDRNPLPPACADVFTPQQMRAKAVRHLQLTSVDDGVWPSALARSSHRRCSPDLRPPTFPRNPLPERAMQEGSIHAAVDSAIMERTTRIYCPRAGIYVRYRYHRFGGRNPKFNRDAPSTLLMQKTPHRRELPAGTNTGKWRRCCLTRFPTTTRPIQRGFLCSPARSPIKATSQAHWLGVINGLPLTNWTHPGTTCAPLFCRNWATAINHTVHCSAQPICVQTGRWPISPWETWRRCQRRADDVGEQAFQ